MSFPNLNQAPVHRSGISPSSSISDDLKTTWQTQRHPSTSVHFHDFIWRVNDVIERWEPHLNDSDRKIISLSLMLMERQNASSGEWRAVLIAFNKCDLEFTTTSPAKKKRNLK